VDSTRIELERLSLEETVVCWWRRFAAWDGWPGQQSASDRGTESRSEYNSFSLRWSSGFS